VTGAGHEWWYHWKADELKRASPGALVPTLIPIDEETGKPDESKVSFGERVRHVSQNQSGVRLSFSQK
jgi:hypothetical protein